MTHYQGSVFLGSLSIPFLCLFNMFRPVSNSSDDAEAAVVEPETEMDMIEPLNLVHMHKYLNLVVAKHTC